MAQNVYEGLFLFDANKFARDHDALPGAVQKMIEEDGGEVLVSRLWEERRLAYPIKGQRKGAYWLMYFRADSQQIAPLNRKCDLKDGVLRQLVLKIHPRLVEPILAHASGEEAIEEPAEGEAAAAPA
ncbi:MAG: 30S ribosomal protein S6 [Planctomycetota bacterium]